MKLALLILLLLAATSAHSASVSLGWAQIQNTNTITGFRIYHSLTPGDYTNFVSIPIVTTYTVTNLPYTLVYFVMTSIGTNGLESSFSNEAVADARRSFIVESSSEPGGPWVPYTNLGTVYFIPADPKQFYRLRVQ